VEATGTCNTQKILLRAIRCLRKCRCSLKKRALERAKFQRLTKNSNHRRRLQTKMTILMMQTKAAGTLSATCIAAAAPRERSSSPIAFSCAPTRHVLATLALFGG
jgi:hypothetical protein